MVWGSRWGGGIVCVEPLVSTLCVHAPSPHQVEALRTMYTRKVRDLEAQLKVGGTYLRGGGVWTH